MVAFPCKHSHGPGGHPHLPTHSRLPARQVAGNAAAGRMTSWALGASWAPGQQKSQVWSLFSGQRQRHGAQGSGHKALRNFALAMVPSRQASLCGQEAVGSSGGSLTPDSPTARLNFPPAQIGAVLSGNGAQSFRLFGQQAVGEEGRTSFAFEYSQGLQGLLAPLLGSPAAVVSAYLIVTP